jgi:hypothetical protein
MAEVVVVVDGLKMVVGGTREKIARKKKRMDRVANPRESCEKEEIEEIKRIQFKMQGEGDEY